jgi:hypothetical protein
LNSAIVFQYGYQIFPFILFVLPAFQFYTNTLEAYYTGIMDLPIVNGASEGTLSVGVFLALSAVFGI